MKELILLLPILVSFFVVLITLPLWIKKCRSIGLLWEDMNKLGHPKNVASSGGLIVVMGFVLGVLSYVAIKTFTDISGNNNALEIFSLLSVILIFAIIGLTDDLLGWKNKGLSIRVRIVLSFLASIPLVVINAGQHTMSLPFFGNVNFGLIYPLLLIPVGIAGASTTYNFLAGFNGLEAGQGILILTFLSYVAFINGSPWLAMIGLCMVASLISFYFFNKFPAKVFPGDIMTYSIGALIASMCILGNFEKIAVIVFIPYILEVILKVRGRLEKHSFGIPRKDGTLKMPYDKVYGLEHLAIKLLGKNATERKVTYLIHMFQILFIIIAFLMI